MHMLLGMKRSPRPSDFHVMYHNDRFPRYDEIFKKALEESPPGPGVELHYLIERGNHTDGGNMSVFNQSLSGSPPYFFEGNTWFGTQETQDNRTDGAVMTQEF